MFYFRTLATDWNEHYYPNEQVMPRHVIAKIWFRRGILISIDSTPIASKANGTKRK